MPYVIIGLAVAWSIASIYAPTRPSLVQCCNFVSACYARSRHYLPSRLSRSAIWRWCHRWRQCTISLNVNYQTTLLVLVISFWVLAISAIGFFIQQLRFDIVLQITFLPNSSHYLLKVEGAKLPFCPLISKFAQWWMFNGRTKGDIFLLFFCYCFTCFLHN